MDAAYDNAYHHKLRGRVWQALRGTEYEETHDADEPTGFVYSNPFPPRDMEEGDDRTLLVASPYEELLAHVAADLLDEPEFNVGEMPFTVDDVVPIDPDVGEPGTSGTIETGTGVLVRIPQERADDYDIDSDGDQAIYWRPHHSMEPFVTRVENNLDRKHGRFAPDYLPGPSDVDGDLFDTYELLKTFAVPVTVTQRQELTYVLSKWRFGYTVRSDDHRRNLNLALDTGIGERNSLGFGFLNVVEGEDG